MVEVFADVLDEDVGGDVAAGLAFLVFAVAAWLFVLAGDEEVLA